MQNQPQTVKAAQDLLKRVLLAMVQHPDLLEVKFREQGPTMLVQIVAHPTDSRIIVGTGASHLKALANLARLLFWGSGKIVTILPIDSNGEQKPGPYRQFKSNAKWPEAEMTKLLSDLAANVFRNEGFRIDSTPGSLTSQNMKVLLLTEPNESALARFNSAIAILFLPIGANQGRMIFASAEKHSDSDGSKIAYAY